MVIRNTVEKNCWLAGGFVLCNVVQVDRRYVMVVKLVQKIAFLVADVVQKLPRNSQTNIRNIIAPHLCQFFGHTVYLSLLYYY